MKEKRPFPGKVLLVDDETNIREGLKAILQKDGHDVRDVASAEAALTLLSNYDAEAAVLDVRMPGMSGTKLLSAIKAEHPYLAVVVLTGHGTLASAITAVKEGAFDYLLKPAKPDALRKVILCALAESRRQREQAALLTALQVGLQRLQQLPAGPFDDRPIQTPTTDLLKMGNLVINCATHEVQYAGQTVSLTPTEYSLLLTLAEKAGAVTDYATLTKDVLNLEVELWEAKELIKRHIYTLRQKLEPRPDQPQFILNVRGVGYRLAV